MNPKTNYIQITIRVFAMGFMILALVLLGITRTKKNAVKAGTLTVCTSGCPYSALQAAIAPTSFLQHQASSTVTLTPDDFVFLPIILNGDPIIVTPTPSNFGVTMHSIDHNGGLDEMVQAGTDWIRTGMLWSDVEPERGQRNWSVLAEFETELINASDEGIQVIFVVQSTPLWAQKQEGTFCGPIVESELPAFANFLYDLVSRYSVAPYNVKYWELWNEPDIDPSMVPPDNFFGCWGDSQDEFYGGGYYAKMLEAVYPEIKAADPEAHILVGGLLLDCDPVSVCPASNAPRFFEGILRESGGKYFDGVSFHSYDYYLGGEGQYMNVGWNTSWDTTGPALIAKSDFLRNIMALYGVSGKFLMNTELAVLCSFGCDTVYETTKANYVAQAYASALVQGLVSNVWYDVFGSWRNTGLLYPDHSPRPAYHAYKFAHDEVGDTSFVQEIVDFSGLKGYEFQKNGQRVWVLWSLDGNTHTIDLPDIPLAVYDIFGNPETPSASLDVDLTPRYLEWSP